MKSEAESGVRKVLVWKVKEGRLMSTELRVAGLKKGKRYRQRKKLAILRKWEKSGNRVELAAKIRVHPETLYRWKKCSDVG